LKIISGSMFLGYKILFRSHASRKTTGHLIGAIIGIGLSLVPLITVIQVSNGMIEGITRRFIEIGSYHMQVRSYSPHSDEETAQAIDILSDHNSVMRAFPIIFGEGLVYSPKGKTGIAVRSLPADSYSADEGLQKYLIIEEGEFSLTGRDDALLSREVADMLNVKSGDKIRLLTAKTLPGRDPVLRPSLFTVRGIFSTGYYELDALSMYIPLDTGRVLFQDPLNFTIGVKLKDPYDRVNLTASELAEELPEDWFVYTWYNLERNMLESFNTTRNLLVFIMVLIVLVAAVNISSSMVMLVLEKEPEIAMLKSMGVSSDKITAAFLYTGFFIGLTAAVLGTILGIVCAVNINEIIRALETSTQAFSSISRNILNPLGFDLQSSSRIFDRSYYLETIPIRLQFRDVLWTAIGTLFLSVAAAYLPARRAGLIRPIEILRKH